MELRAVHRLSDGDPATSLSFYRIPGDPLAHLKAAGQLGGGQTRDAGQKHIVRMQGVPYRRP